YKEDKSATNKALNYYIHSDKYMSIYGRVSKIADGVFYKEKVGRFGVIPPSNDALINALIYSGKKQVGYVGGEKLFNMTGLTTQVPSKILIITSKQAPAKIYSSGLYIEVKKKKTSLTKLDIKSKEFSFILNHIDEVQSLEKENLVDHLSDYLEYFLSNKRAFNNLYSNLKYKKNKAFLGAIIQDYDELNDEFSYSEYLAKIKSDLSDNSKYKVGRLKYATTHFENWNLIT
ncbi:hypothetical protein, partial [Vibrio harveyi]